MASTKITQKDTSQLKNDAHVLVTQPETVDGELQEALRRIPLSNFLENIGAVKNIEKVSGQDTGTYLKITYADGTNALIYIDSGSGDGGGGGGASALQIPVTLSNGVYTVEPEITAEDIVANKGNLVIILNGSIEYVCAGALTSDFGYGHFYFVAAKPSGNKIETEWLDLSFFTGENSSVTVLPVSFDIGTTWLNVQYDSDTDSYTPNFTAADVSLSLPNAMLHFGERSYNPVGWEFDDSVLVNATFARAMYDSTGFAGFDCFKVNNTDGSFTVQRYTVPASPSGGGLVYELEDDGETLYIQNLTKLQDYGQEAF